MQDDFLLLVFIYKSVETCFIPKKKHFFKLKRFLEALKSE